LNRSQTLYKRKEDDITLEQNFVLTCVIKTQKKTSTTCKHLCYFLQMSPTIFKFKQNHFVLFDTVGQYVYVQRVQKKCLKVNRMKISAKLLAVSTYILSLSLHNLRINHSIRSCHSHNCYAIFTVSSDSFLSRKTCG